MVALVALDTIGWRLTELRPSLSAGAGMWHVTIERVDYVASMSATAPDPDGALEELARYAAADAEEEAPRR